MPPQRSEGGDTRSHGGHGAPWGHRGGAGGKPPHRRPSPDPAWPHIPPEKGGRRGKVTPEWGAASLSGTSFPTGPRDEGTECPHLGGFPGQGEGFRGGPGGGFGPSVSHQLFGEQQSGVVVALQSPGGEAEDVLLVALQLGHGPVLPFQFLLLSHRQLLRGKGKGKGGDNVTSGQEGGR